MAEVILRAITTESVPDKYLQCSDCRFKLGGLDRARNVLDKIGRGGQIEVNCEKSKILPGVVKLTAVAKPICGVEDTFELSNVPCPGQADRN